MLCRRRGCRTEASVGSPRETKATTTGVSKSVEATQKLADQVQVWSTLGVDKRPCHALKRIHRRYEISCRGQLIHRPWGNLDPHVCVLTRAFFLRPIGDRASHQVVAVGQLSHLVIPAAKACPFSPGRMHGTMQVCVVCRLQDLALRILEFHENTTTTKPGFVAYNGRLAVGYDEHRG